MSAAEELTQAEVAELLGVNRHMLSKAAPYLQGFPSAGQIGGHRRRYQRAEILAWREGRDVKAEVSAAGSLARAGQPDAEETAFNQLSRAFLVGAYDSPQQRDTVEFKKLVARQCKKPGGRLVITIVPDWMQDQRGFEPPKTKIIERHI
jgi:predicted DNA-binding transcriptional regulator AlpA